MIKLLALVAILCGLGAGALVPRFEPQAPRLGQIEVATAQAQHVSQHDPER
ncbi:MAG: hypothetical protein JO081_08440 [Alphaproteobacteria bacterium]|nr:hypothetical protein [Alphaproteobacteria bacterium]